MANKNNKESSWKDAVIWLGVIAGAIYGYNLEESFGSVALYGFIGWVVGALFVYVLQLAVIWLAITVVLIFNVGRLSHILCDVFGLCGEGAESYLPMVQDSALVIVSSM